MKRLWILGFVLLPLACWLALKTSRLTPSIEPLSVSASVGPADRNQLGRLADSSAWPGSSSGSVPLLPPALPLGATEQALPQSNLISAIPNPSPAPRPAAPSADLPLVVIAADNVNTLQPEQVVMMRYLAEDFLAATETAPMSPTTSGPKRGRRPKTEWERAVELSDARFQAMFGQDAFNALLVERAVQAASAK